MLGKGKQVMRSSTMLHLLVMAAARFVSMHVNFGADYHARTRRRASSRKLICLTHMPVATSAGYFGSCEPSMQQTPAVSTIRLENSVDGTEGMIQGEEPESGHLHHSRTCIGNFRGAYFVPNGSSDGSAAAQAISRVERSFRTETHLNYKL